MAILDELNDVLAQLPHNRTPLVLQQLQPALHSSDHLLAATQGRILPTLSPPASEQKGTMEKDMIDRKNIIRNYHFEAFRHPNRMSNMAEMFFEAASSRALRAFKRTLSVESAGLACRSATNPNRETKHGSSKQLDFPAGEN